MDGQEFTYSWIDYNDQEWGNKQKLKVSLKGKEINLKKKNSNEINKSFQSEFQYNNSIHWSRLFLCLKNHNSILSNVALILQNNKFSRFFFC